MVQMIGRNALRLAFENGTATFYTHHQKQCRETTLSHIKVTLTPDLLPNVTEELTHQVTNHSEKYYSLHINVCPFLLSTTMNMRCINVS